MLLKSGSTLNMVLDNKVNKISAIIQARMGSERLPGKVLMKISGKTVLWHIIERLRLSKLINQIILAIPNTRENDILEQFEASSRPELTLTFHLQLMWDHPFTGPRFPLETYFARFQA